MPTELSQSCSERQLFQELADLLLELGAIKKIDGYLPASDFSTVQEE